MQVDCCGLRSTVGGLLPRVDYHGLTPRDSLMHDYHEWTTSG